MIESTLTAAFEPLSTIVVESFVRKHYGLTVDAKPLPSELDQQFALHDERDARYVLKVSHPLENADVIEMQIRALMHILAVDPTIPVPKPIAAPSGDYISHQDWSRQGFCNVRLVSYIHGVPLHSVPRTLTQARQMGRMLARLAQALESFSHAAAARHLNWDLIHAGEVVTLLDAMAEARYHSMAREALARFRHDIEPALRKLRRQVVHNDFHEHNILVNVEQPDHIVGILDFGDLVRTQLINDVAIGASYLVCQGDASLPLAKAFVAGFQDRLPLEPEERRILVDLMAVRLAMTVGITEWRARRFPDKAAYIRKNLATAYRGLEILHPLTSKERFGAFEKASGQ